MHTWWNHVNLLTPFKRPLSRMMYLRVSIGLLILGAMLGWGTHLTGWLWLVSSLLLGLLFTIVQYQRLLTLSFYVGMAKILTGFNYAMVWLYWLHAGWPHWFQPVTLYDLLLTIALGLSMVLIMISLLKDHVKLPRS